MANPFGFLNTDENEEVERESSWGFRPREMREHSDSDDDEKTTSIRLGRRTESKLPPKKYYDSKQSTSSHSSRQVPAHSPVAAGSAKPRSSDLSSSTSTRGRVRVTRDRSPGSPRSDPNDSEPEEIKDRRLVREVKHHKDVSAASAAAARPPRSSTPTPVVAAGTIRDDRLERKRARPASSQSISTFRAHERASERAPEPSSDDEPPSTRRAPERKGQT